MAVKYNPFTGSFDLTGGGGGNPDFEVYRYISTSTASNDASLDFTDLTGTSYLLQLRNVIPQDDFKSLLLTASNDNGSTFLSTDYQYAGQNVDASSNVASFGFAGGSFIRLMAGTPVGNASNEFGVNGAVFVYNMNSSTSPMFGRSHVQYQIHTNGQLANSINSFCTVDDGGGTARTDINALRISFQSSNIGSGQVQLYEIKTS